jgi:hypothetical protein
MIMFGRCDQIASIDAEITDPEDRRRISMTRIVLDGRTRKIIDRGSI